MPSQRSDGETKPDETKSGRNGGPAVRKHPGSAPEAVASVAKPNQRVTEGGPPHPPLRLEWIDADSLAENPANWRRHPPEQLAALQDVLAEVGWAGACLFNERTHRLIDGHLRKKVSRGKGKVPVLVGSWSEEQEKKILATLDPIAAPAETDKAALDRDSFTAGTFSSSIA